MVAGWLRCKSASILCWRSKLQWHIKEQFIGGLLYSWMSFRWDVWKLAAPGVCVCAGHVKRSHTWGEMCNILWTSFSFFSSHWLSIMGGKTCIWGMVTVGPAFLGFSNIKLNHSMSSSFHLLRCSNWYWRKDLEESIYVWNFNCVRSLFFGEKQAYLFSF